MLVLSRNTGEEIVLPGRGVTIGVVAVKGKQVRLGISAPSETSVHRGEVCRRIHQSHQSPQTTIAGKDGLQGTTASRDKRSHHKTLLETDVTDDWRHETKRRITARTQGRVFDTEVELIDDRLVVRGRSRSYYGKQLAVAAALELIEALDSTPVAQVELDIEVIGG